MLSLFCTDDPPKLIVIKLCMVGVTHEVIECAKLAVDQLIGVGSAGS
jgi:hypothetical protein